MLFVMVFIYGCSKHKDTKPVSDNAVITVTVSTPKYQLVPIKINATGLIQAWQETIIGAQIGGVGITNVYVNVGDTVKKGQLLAKFNATQVKSDLMTQIANLSEADANLEQAKVEVNQASILEKSGAISSHEFLEYTTKLKTTEARRSAAIAALDFQKLRMGYTLVRSPDSGIISSQTATAGSLVQNGSELFRLIRGGKLSWNAEVSLENFGLIKHGQTAIINLGSGRQIKGFVRQMSPSLNVNSKNGIVFIDLPNDTEFKVGMNVSGIICAGTSKVLVVPFKSIISSDGYSYILRLSKNNRVHRVKVKLGQIFESMAEVSGEISLSDKVVVDGAQFLNEGDSVRLGKGM